jgi:RNA polymerase subunit RPABC4/transcription elongation factor Spt4
MSKATGVGTIVFGLILIILGIGAYFSGEASAQTQEGRIGIGFVIILGLAAIYGGVTAREKANAKPQQAPQMPQPMLVGQAPETMQTMEAPLPPPPPSDAVATAFCPYCGKAIQADFVACPFCGKSIRKTCPNCGKQVQQDFVACPYCGAALKGA